MCQPTAVPLTLSSGKGVRYKKTDLCFTNGNKWLLYSHDTSSVSILKEMGTWVNPSAGISRPSTSLQRLIRARSRQSSRWIFYEKSRSVRALEALVSIQNASNANVVRVVLLDANSYLALSMSLQLVLLLGLQGRIKE
jgi:hypothetical protein